MPSSSIHAVTGAFGYSGKYIAKKLLAKGCQVITLTNSIDRTNEFGGQVQAFPFNFDKPDELARSLQKIEVLYNTYWVRFNHRLFKHADAVRNTLVLFEAARRAGVKRIVHISIANPSADSALEYFSGKARLEKALIDSGMSYAILRPTVVFGKEDILVNNIAWVLRRFPAFGLFGNGDYKLQPIYVEDLAELAVQYGERRENAIVDAIGPETFTYRELVETIGRLIGVRRMVISLPPAVVYWIGRTIGCFMGDVMITRPEIEGLMADLLYTDSPPSGKTRLTDWIAQHSATLGKRYTSELARRSDRLARYRSN
jgi:NADH dehydrogenase